MQSLTNNLTKANARLSQDNRVYGYKNKNYHKKVFKFSALLKNFKILLSERNGCSLFTLCTNSKPSDNYNQKRFILTVKNYIFKRKKCKKSIIIIIRSIRLQNTGWIIIVRTSVIVITIVIVHRILLVVVIIVAISTA